MTEPKFNVFLAFTLLPLIGNGQFITYEWPGPVHTIQSYPEGNDAHFRGTVAEWNDVQLLVADGADGAEMRTGGWSSDPGGPSVSVNVLAYAAMVLDSIIIQHRRGPDGPHRLLVTMTAGSGTNEHVIADEVILESYGTTRIGIHALMRPHPGNEYTHAHIKLVAYGGGEGYWYPRSLSVVGCSPDVEPEPVPTIEQFLAGQQHADPRTVQTGNDMGK